LNKGTWSTKELYDYDKKRDDDINAKSQIETAGAEGEAKGRAEGAGFQLKKLMKLTMN
jgi:hypothetical protein